MSDLNPNKQALISKEINRKEFLRDMGILAGGGALASLLPRISRAKSDFLKSHKILVPDMEGANYWEVLTFSCYQGIVNRHQPRVFLFYPNKTDEGWYEEYPVEEKRVFYNWYKQYVFLQFDEIGNRYNLFQEMGKDDSIPLNGFVMVDTQIPITANIAANYASIENLLPVTPSIFENYRSDLPDLPIKKDLRGQFQDMQKLEIYEWTFQHQWPQANHARVANLATPKPAPVDELPTNSFHTSNRSRDYTVAERGFFFDLQSAGAEYKLKDRILKAMQPHGYVFGWHQGAGETAHISHLSKNGQLALGASTYAANFSFHSRVKVPGAVERFRNKVSQKDNSQKLENKIYLTFVLSDGNSLNYITRKGLGGEWQLPERGEVPFGWELLPALIDVGPGILDYFQATATQNDYFVASVSGITDFYPRAMSLETLRKTLKLTKKYLNQTGQSSLVVMGPSGPVDDERAQLYYDILGGQINGVMEGYSRRSAKSERLYYDKGNPNNTMSWLPTSDPLGEKDVNNWIQELKQIPEVRKERPLFIPLHLPGHKLTVADMVKMTNALGDEFKAVSPDAFYRLFAKARKESILVNTPEGFPVNDLTLQSGHKNKINVSVQNFSNEERWVNLRTKIEYDVLAEPIYQEKTVHFQGKQTNELRIYIEIPEEAAGSNGRIKYSIDNNDPQLSIPVHFK